MITRITVKNKNGLQIVLNPVIKFTLRITGDVSGNTVSLNVNYDPGTIQAPYVTSINKVSPDLLYNILILGDMCTSVIDSTDPSFLKFNVLSQSFGLFNPKGITIFDGCTACSSCDTVARMQDTIKNYLIWLNGMKDCQLYYEGGASKLWEDMKAKKSSELDYLQGCDRGKLLLRSFGTATRLLYQYKAMVYMWNYIVFLKAGATLIIQAALSYSGFVVRSKRSVDTCDSSTSPVILMHMLIDLVQGQTALNLNKNLKMYIYATVVSLNTQIEINSPSGSIVPTGILSYGDITHNLSVEGTHVYAVIKFTPKQTCKGIFSGGIKILPVLAYEDDLINLTLQGSIDLGTYVKLKNKANNISEELQLEVNRWQAAVWWLYDNFGSKGKIDRSNSSLTKVYTTGYYAYPKGDKDALLFLL